jgi:hypothetical protein
VRLLRAVAPAELLQAEDFATATLISPARALRSSTASFLHLICGVQSPGRVFTSLTTRAPGVV